jgi:hypothetical protein
MDSLINTSCQGQRCKAGEGVRARIIIINNSSNYGRQFWRQVRLSTRAARVAQYSVLKTLTFLNGLFHKDCLSGTSVTQVLRKEGGVSVRKNINCEIVHLWTQYLSIFFAFLATQSIPNLSQKNNLRCACQVSNTTRAHCRTTHDPSENLREFWAMSSLKTTDTSKKRVNT